jgi:hypothetical protein
VKRSYPNKAVDVVVNQTLEKQVVFSQANKTHLRSFPIIQNVVP